MNTISNVLINIFSSYFYDKMNIWSEKKNIKKFIQELSEWVKEFEQKNDGTIVTQGIFISYIENFKIIQKMLKYVLDASEKEEGEISFIKKIQENFKQYAIEENVPITVVDSSILKEFFNTLFDRIRIFIYSETAISDRAILYCLVQTRLDLHQAAEHFSIAEETLRRLEDEILAIRISQKNEQSYSCDWFIRQNNEQIKNLGNRYLPDLNISTNTSKIFDGLAKNDEFYSRLENKTDSFLAAVNKTKLKECKDLTDFVREHIEGVLQGTEKEIKREEIISYATEIQSIIRKKIDDLLLKDEHDGNRIYFLRDGYEQIEHYIEYLNSNEVKASIMPYVLIYGEGGCGKSHLLADAIRKRNSNNNKSILFLGQHFRGQVNPMLTMMQLIDSRDNFEIFLDNLNKIGEQENSRIVIFIDALNEGDGKTIWKDYLSGMLEKIKRFRWIALVVTIRSEYIRHLFIENKELKQEFLHVHHRGFRNIRYEAIKKYFTFYNIGYMEIPFENPEFENPLFLRLFCEAYQGESVNLKGIDLKDVYNKYLEKINESISDKCEVNYRYKIVQKIIRNIVMYKFEKNAGNNVISIEEVMNIVLELQQKYGCKKDLLEQLLSEGILTQNILGSGEEYIYITYERMEDYIYAEKLYEELKKMSAESFSKQYKNLIYNSGILYCFAIEAAQTDGKEIFEIFDGANSSIKEAFIESLKWRRDKIINKNVKDYINNFIMGDRHAYIKFIDTLIFVGTRKDYAFNADRFANFVFGMPMPDRDAYFIPIFNQILQEDECSINRLLDWGIELRENEEILDETLRLASLTLSVFLISSNRLLRDKATKTMINILKGHIDIVVYLINKFAEIDDPYVVERLYAVAFGCIVSEQDDNKIRLLANVVYQNIFATEVVYPNILVRDYALNIIDYAVYRLEKVDFDIKKCEPPYNTLMPEIPTDDEISGYKFDYNAPNFKDYYWAQNIIISSMHVEYSRDGRTGDYGDFGRYIFQRYFRNWRGLNYNDLENIAVKKIFDMGYDVEKHGRFDRRIGGGRTSSNKIERIGKKYQWIALYELAAHVSDNFKIKMEDSEYTGKAEGYCRGAYEPNIRNLDPTISRMPMGTKKTIHEKLYKMPSINHEKWLENFDDLPLIQKMIYQIHNAQKYFLLNGWYSWDEKKKIGDEKYRNPLKDMWVQINSYIVKKDRLNDYINNLKNADFMGRYLSEPNDNYSLYNKEYYWSHGYRFFQNPYYGGEELTLLDKLGEKYTELPNVLVPTVKYLTEREGDLLYEDSHSMWYKPCLELFEGLGMQYGKENSILYDKNGEILCFDSIELLKEDIGFFIAQDEFLEFLEQKGYGIFWTVLAEKRIITGFPYGEKEYPMPHISGLFYLNDKRKIIGKMHKVIKE